MCRRYAQDMPKICPRYAQDMPKIWPPVRRSWQNVFLTKRLSRSAWKKCRTNRSWQNVFLTKRLSWSWQNVFLTKRLRRSWQNVFLTKRLLTYRMTCFKTCCVFSYISFRGLYFSRILVSFVLLVICNFRGTVYPTYHLGCLQGRHRLTQSSKVLKQPHFVIRT